MEYKNLIEGEVVQPKSRLWSWIKNTKGWPWGYVGLSIIILPFFIVGVCNAAVVGWQWYLENSLANNVKSVHTTMTSCEDSYKALYDLKNKLNIPMAKDKDGNPLPDPCTF